LTVFARARLAPKVARRVDPEDIVMSAYRSFFVRARDGHLSLRRSGDLWRLLVAITLNKIRRQAAHHQAEKRSIRREEDLNLSANDPLASRPPPEHAIAMADELEQVMEAVSPDKRRVLELRLLDRSHSEIAAEVGRSERTIRRMLHELQDYLQRRLLNNG
jgi:RNA polymerase sigma factor (sigma-70 family)